MQRRGLSPRRLKRFSTCGSNAYLQVNTDDPSQHRLVANTCHDRHCLPCQQERSRLIARNLLDQLPPSSLRFLTLTLRSSDEPLAAQLDRLYKAFTSLRRAKAFRERVLGGVAFLELTWSDSRHQWHPHLHTIICGRFIAQSDISAMWHERTRDSHVVDIRKVHDAGEVASYVTKYVSKTAVPDGSLSDYRLDEWCHALEHRKLCICWGTFRSFRLLARDPSDASWEPLCSLSVAIRRVREGDTRMAAILESLCPVRFADLLLELSQWHDSS